MKFATVLTIVIIASAAPLAHGHADHGKPQYGGIYGEAGTFQLELVAHDHEIILYATVHGEPLSTKDASGKLVILSADGKAEVELKPTGGNQLVAKLKTRLASGSKLVANVTLAGKSPANIRYAID